MATIFSAPDLASWYGKGALTSSPNAGVSGSNGYFGNYRALPGLSGASPYQFTDITEPMKGTAATTDYRPAVAKGAAAPTGYEYDPSLFLSGKAINAIAQVGTAASKDYGPLYTSQAAKLAYALSERAKQEAAAGRAENLARGNTILAGYEQQIGNNRAASDQVMAMNAGYGESMKRDLAREYVANLAKSNQSAIRRGLGNTTVRDSLNRGVQSDYDLSRLRLGDMLTQRNIGLFTDALGRDNQLTTQRLGFLGSVVNDYPTSADFGNYLLQSGVLEETKGSRK